MTNKNTPRTKFLFRNPLFQGYEGSLEILHKSRCMLNHPHQVQVGAGWVALASSDPVSEDGG